MIKIVLDTNIYSGDPNRQKAGFKVLSKLISEFKIQLFIPDIVKREFVTQRTDEYQDTVEKAQKSLKDILRKKLDARLKQKVEKILKDFDATKADIVSYPEWDFSNWAYQARAKNLKVDDIHIKPVFEAYFKGKMPFSTKKSRKDIPDAFIFETIKRLSYDHDEIHAVINDKNLRGACQQIGNVKTYPTLKDFIASDTVKPVLEKLEAIEKALPGIIDKLKEDPKFLDGLIDGEIVDRLSGQIITESIIPDDNNEATILGASEPDAIEYSWDEISTFADDTIIVPFNFITEVLTYYYVFKPDAYTLDDERLERVGLTDHNNHYFEAEEYFEIEVQGELRLQVNTDELTEDIYELVNTEESGIEDISEIKIFHHFDE